MSIVARDIIGAIIDLGAVQVLKSAGFKKSALRFQRRCGETLQVVNFQLSQGNFADSGRFYINVGIGFDKLWELASEEIPDRPKAHECHFDKRLNELLPKAPTEWNISASTDVAAAATELRAWMISLVSQLDGINSTEALLQRGGLNIGAELILRAKLHYVAADFKAAFEDLKSAAQFFSDRQGTSLVEIIQGEKMPELRRFM